MESNAKFIFLGTGDKCGIPKIGCECSTCLHARKTRDRTVRTRTAHLLLVDEKPIFIDAGPDLRSQMLKHEIKSASSIWLTHPHFDHVFGLHEFYRVSRNIDLYALPEAIEYVIHRLGLEFMKFNPHPIQPYQPINYLGMTFTPFLVSHKMWEGMRALGFSIEWNQFKLVITGDTTRHLPPETLELIQNPDILITDVFTDRFFFDGLPHMILSEAIELADSIGARSAYFTHCSHRTPNHSAFDEMVIKKNKKYRIAYDGLEIQLPPV